MAVNPELFSNGMPVPFVNEMFVLARDGVEFEIDKIPGSHGGHVQAKGTIYLSNIRMVFVANKAVGSLIAFDMPLLYVRQENVQPACVLLQQHIRSCGASSTGRAAHSSLLHSLV